MAFARQKRDDGGMIGDIERDTFGFAGDAGIAGGAVKPVGQRACRHLPGQRMLAAAGAQQQNIHVRQPFSADLTAQARSAALIATAGS